MSGAARCNGEPISWLRLERYHLGEVDDAERERIARHLASCRACAACLEKIRADDESALPAIVPARPGARVRRLPRAVIFSSTIGTLAAAAAVVLALRGGGAPSEAGGHPGEIARVKGDAMAFSLVREDGTRIDGDAGTYREGDRWKALVTCPPGEGVSLDLVVFDADGASFPLEPSPDFACGNDAPMRGAFRLTGHGEAEVCLAWSSAGPVDRGSLAPSRAGAPGRVCKTLSAR